MKKWNLTIRDLIKIRHLIPKQYNSSTTDKQLKLEHELNLIEDDNKRCPSG